MINSPQYVPNMYQQPVCYMPPMPNYCDHQQSAVAARNAQPRYSGVSIEIIEPQVKAPGAYPCMPSAYGMPQQPVYDYPLNNIYGGGFYQPQPFMQYPPIQQPVMMPPQPPVMPQPQPQVTQLPPSVIPPVPQPQPAPVQPQVTQLPPAQPEPAPAPTVINQPTVVYPTPQPQAPEQPQVVQQTVQQAPVQQTAPSADLTTVVSKLKSQNFDEQAKVMEDIATTMESNPAAGVQYLDTNVVNSLVDVLNQDTTKLAGPTPRQQALRQKLMGGQAITDAEKIEASQLSPMEIGERNKQYALYTIAMLQDSLSKEIVKQQGVQMPINELPAIENVIETAKKCPNPMLRASALAGLSYISKPEYKDILGTIFNIAATTDEDPTVQEVAKEALNKLNGATATATATATAPQTQAA